jgi:ABC-type lipoprotein release transport system permease subunit
LVDWLKYLIIAAIPLVGLVMCFVWAFGRGNLNRRNLFRAALILMAAGIVLGIIISVVFGAVFQGFFGQFFDLFRGI